MHSGKALTYIYMSKAVEVLLPSRPYGHEYTPGKPREDHCSTLMFPPLLRFVRQDSENGDITVSSRDHD